MADYVQYHNVEKMGYEEISEPLVFSKKSAPYDSRVWLISGKGTPRRYHLRSVFTVAKIEQGFDGENILSGPGHVLEKPPELTDEPWFLEFKRTQQNFKGGLSKIDEKFVPEFEQLYDPSTNS